MNQNNQHNKADAGKLRPSLLIEGMPNALMAVSAVLTYGALKYEPNGWKTVETERYKDAKYRHILDLAAGQAVDDESGLIHEAHEVCNALFILEQKLAALTPAKRARLLRFNEPPRNHRHEPDTTDVSGRGKFAGFVND